MPDSIAAERGLPGRLAEAGYRVAAFVSTNAFGDRLGLGAFDPWDAKQKSWRRGTDAVEHALEWLDGTVHGEKRPVFLWVQLQDCTRPTAAPRRGRRASGTT